MKNDFPNITKNVQHNLQNRGYPFDPLGAQGDRKGAKVEPKAIEKLVQRHLVERAKTMAGIVREGHGEVPGRVQEPVFSGTRCEGFPIRSRGGFGMIFCDFRCPLGVTGGSIFKEKRVLFKV